MSPADLDRLETLAMAATSAMRLDRSRGFVVDADDGLVIDADGGMVSPADVALFVEARPAVLSLIGDYRLHERRIAELEATCADLREKAADLKAIACGVTKGDAT